MKIKRAGIALFVFLSVPLSTFGHHAFTGVFDMDNLTELEGEITRLLWRNPHVRFTMRSATGESWDIETNSVSILSRMDVSPELLAEGDTISVAGFPARDGSNEMWVNNLLLSDGREVVTRPGVAPHWSTEHLGESAFWLAGGDSNARERGIFRVWSTRFNGPGRVMNLADYPLTIAAAAVRASFDPLVDNPIDECTPKGMPWIMHQPYPVEFTQDGDKIFFHIEEYDLVRTVHMNPDAVDKNAPRVLLGHSVGHWDGDDLIVETHSVDWAHFNAAGIRQSPAATFVERFSPSDDGANLDYTITVTDPATFTEPVTLRKQWVWREGETVKPYECARY